MRNFIPKKSIFGFNVFNSWESILSSYFLIIFFYIIAPNFREDNLAELAENFFLIIINSSLIILTFNALFQQKKMPSLIWLIVIIPLCLLIPFEIKIIFYALKNLLY